jgi:hypothetical protein
MATPSKKYTKRKNTYPRVERKRSTRSRGPYSIVGKGGTSGPGITNWQDR